MARNYEKEHQWQLKKYDEIRAKVDRNLGEEFRAKLKKEKRTIAGWMTENIKKYLKEDTSK